MKDFSVSFADIKAMITEFHGALSHVGIAAQERQAHLVKPKGSLGRLEILAEWISTWQGHHPPTMKDVGVRVFAANHGVVVHGVSAYPAEVTAKMVEIFQKGGAAINQLCHNADADLRIHAFSPSMPTDDFTQGPAMSQEACCQALAVGMEMVDDGLDLLCLGEMGIGNTTSASALCCALFGGATRDWIGAGTGIDAAGLARKEKAIIKALEVNNITQSQDPLHILQCLGGYEIAALVGAIISARRKSIPVLLDGFVTTAAASVLFKYDPHALDHCLVAHRSAEQAHGNLLTILDKEPLFDFAMRLGEGSGAALAIPVIRGAIACHTKMLTFEEAGITAA